MSHTLCPSTSPGPTCFAWSMYRPQAKMHICRVFPDVNVGHNQKNTRTKTARRKIFLATNRPTRQTVFGFFSQPEKSLTTKNAKKRKTDCGCELRNSSGLPGSSWRVFVFGTAFLSDSLCVFVFGVMIVSTQIGDASETSQTQPNCETS